MIMTVKLICIFFKSHKDKRFISVLHLASWNLNQTECLLQVGKCFLCCCCCKVTDLNFIDLYLYILFIHINEWKCRRHLRERGCIQITCCTQGNRSMWVHKTLRKKTDDRSYNQLVQELCLDDALNLSGTFLL